MKIIPTILAAAALTAPAIAQTTPDAVAAKVEPAIEQVYLKGDDAPLAGAIAELDAALAKDPSNPALLYEKGFALYAKTSASRAKNDKGSLDSELEDARHQLGRVRGQPWQAEAESLESGILGELIGVRGGMAGMMLGPRSGVLMGRAAKELPSSPRVLLFRGISLLNTPPAYGGDIKQALQLIKESVDGFAADKGGPGPHWGTAEGFAWLGFAEQKNGDTAGAREAWNKAMAAEPGYPWVKFVLLPMLGQ